MRVASFATNVKGHGKPWPFVLPGAASRQTRPGLILREPHWRGSMTDTVCIHTYPNRVEAEIAAQILKAGGVNAVVATDDAAGWRPEMNYGRGVRLLVAPSVAAKARELLARETEDQSRKP